MALTTLQSIQAEIQQLEARKKLVEKRDNDVPKALAILETYASVLTDVQRRKVAKIIGEVVAPAVGRPAKKASKVKKGGKVPPKYQLATGEAWTGRGRTPLAFVAWSEAHPGKDYPAAPGAAPAKVKKAGKKVASNAPSKKAGKKVVKKARKTAKKA